MKNIHLVLTGESRLSLNRSYRDYAIGTEASEPYWTYGTWVHNMSVTDASVRPHNIYITSDEEIKEGDWYLDTFNTQRIKANQFSDHKHYGNACKKIILTTDQDLIKDGVQAIDDEFLEGFVKNPSCEWVEFEESNLLNTSRTYLGVDKYKIIIPKEEPKQYSKVLSENGNELFFDEQGYLIKEEAKQETLLQIANRKLMSNDWLNGAEFGAKWQQEQDNKMYSEEDMKSSFQVGFNVGYNDEESPSYLTFEEWIKEYKKK